MDFLPSKVGARPNWNRYNGKAGYERVSDTRTAGSVGQRRSGVRIAVLAECLRGGPAVLYGRPGTGDYLECAQWVGRSALDGRPGHTTNSAKRCIETVSACERRSDSRVTAGGMIKRPLVPPAGW